MAWERVRVKAPKHYRGEHGDEPLEVWAIRVWEPNSSAGVKEPLEWLLLTNVEVQTDGQAPRAGGLVRVAAGGRGVSQGADDEDGDRGPAAAKPGGLEPLIGLLSILAVTLVSLRQQARQQEAATQPARGVVDPLWGQVLSIWMYGEQRDLSLRQFVLDLAKLGGYLKRRRDAWPG
jgi:hypothetical protein